MKKKANKIVINTLVIAGIALTFLALLATPFISGAFFKSSDFASEYKYAAEAATVIVYCLAAPFVFALFKLRKICSLMFSDDIFSETTAKKFRDIGICFFAEGFVFLLITLVLYIAFDIFMYAVTVLPAIIIPFVCIVGGLIFLAFSGIFRRAAEIKEENDGIF